MLRIWRLKLEASCSSAADLSIVMSAGTSSGGTEPGCCTVAMIAETACEAVHSTKGASTSLNAVGPKK